MHFHALASFQQGVNINSVHRPCHMLELPRGNPLHTFSYPLCYQPTLFEIPTSAINQVLLIASFSYHQLLLTFPSGWCAYFLALLSIFANAGILEHKGSPNGTNLELTQDHVLQARMLWIFNRRDRCCKKVHCVFFLSFSHFSSFSSFCIEVENVGADFVNARFFTKIWHLMFQSAQIQPTSLNVRIKKSWKKTRKKL